MELILAAFDENADEKVAQQNKIKFSCADEVDFFPKDSSS